MLKSTLIISFIFHLDYIRTKAIFLTTNQLLVLGLRNPRARRFRNVLFNANLLMLACKQGKV